MKPPKAFRGVVNTLFGINKKTKEQELGSSASVPVRPSSYDDLDIADRRRTKSNRDSFTLAPQHTQSLPRRSQSYASGTSDQQPSFNSRIESRLMPHEKNGQPIEFENHRPVDFESNSCRATSLPARGNTFPDPFLSRRSFSTSSAQNQQKPRSSQLILNDYDEKIHFTNSSRSEDYSQNSSRTKQTLNRIQNEKIGYQKNDILKNANPKTTSSSAVSSVHGSEVAESKDKLFSCLDALDRLSQQVKRINEVSEKVKRVEKYSQHDPQKERHLRELNMAAQASMRIKSLIRSEFDRSESGARHSSQSSGYSSDGSRRSSNSPTNLPRISPVDKLYNDIRQTTLPPIRRSNQDKGYYRSAPGSTNYPQSIQDLMPIWDEKERHMKGNARVSYDGSVSSGYMTGSSSEEEQRNSPPINGYPFSAGYTTNHPNPQQHWGHPNYQHGNQFYPGYEYNPDYDYYGAYGQFQSDGETHEDDMYGYYGYPSSSIQDGEIYMGNGWYRLPGSQAPQNKMHEEVQQQQHHQMMHPEGYQPQEWSTSMPMHGAQKYGGLSEIFYDPQTPAPSMQPQMAFDSQDDASSMASFNSFNNFRKMPAKTTSKGSKKTVRFSQTVRQRVETEESEMEDSTGVIKACRDEGNDKILTKKDLEKQQQEYNLNSEASQSIYYWPGGVPAHSQMQQMTAASYY